MSVASSRLVTVPLATALATALALDGLRAQEHESSLPAKQGESPDQTVSIDFGGGSLTALVRALREAKPGVNIVFLPEPAAHVELPALTLRDVTVDAALEAVAHIVVDEHRVDVGVQRGKTGQPIHYVRVRDDRARSQAAPAGVQPSLVRVFSVKALTDAQPGDPGAGRTTFSAQTILTAIDTGLEIAGSEGSGKAVVRYHQDSGLLFVQGTPMQVQLAEEVLHRLRENVAEMRQPAAPQPAPKEEPALPPKAPRAGDR